MAPTTRVKVLRTVLIERIQETIDKVSKERDDAIANYDKEVADFLAALPGLMEARAKEIAAMTDEKEKKKFVEKLGGSWHGDKGCLVYIKVTPPHLEMGEEYRYRTRDGYGWRGYDGYIQSLEKSKRVLEASTEELISVSANDEYANYL